MRGGELVEGDLRSAGANEGEVMGNGEEEEGK